MTTAVTYKFLANSHVTTITFASAAAFENSTQGQAKNKSLEERSEITALNFGIIYKLFIKRCNNMT